VTRHPSVVVRADVVKWPPALVLTVASRSADLLVVGARGRGGFKELLLGSVSDQCVQYSHCPVVVVSQDMDGTGRSEGGARIVVGVDGSFGSAQALRWALDEARIRSASVEAVYVWQYPPIGAFVLGPPRDSRTSARRSSTEHGNSTTGGHRTFPFDAVAHMGPTYSLPSRPLQRGDLLVLGSRDMAASVTRCWARWLISVPDTRTASWSSRDHRVAATTSPPTTSTAPDAEPAVVSERQGSSTSPRGDSSSERELHQHHPDPGRPVGERRRRLGLNVDGAASPRACRRTISWSPRAGEIPAAAVRQSPCTSTGRRIRKGRGGE